MQNLADFFVELKRRRVFRVAVVYAGVAFVITEIVGNTFSYLGIPDWFGTAIIVLIIICFPIAIGLAWAFDITDKGIVRTKGKAEAAETPRRPIFSNLTLAIVAALAVAVAMWSWLRSPGEAFPDKSIAVLPFANFSDNKDDEYFSDGIADDILTHLSKIGDLKVIARTSVMQYKNTEKRIRDIGRELGVATLLEGSVRRADNRVRITSQLVDAKTEEHLWAETYDRDLMDIFAIQNDVASQIAAALKATLTPEEQDYIEEKPTDNLEAYDYYLKGNYYWENFVSREGNEKAVRMYEKAVELDPEFALAYAKLAIVDFALYSNIAWDHSPERLQKGMAAMEKAGELSPDLSEVHSARGKYYDIVLGDHDRALVQYEIALQKQPNNSQSMWDMGRIYAIRGEWDQAEAYILKGHDLDPQDGVGCLYVSQFYAFLRNWTEAVRWANLAISIDPVQGVYYSRKASAYIDGYGNLAQAREVLEEAVLNTNERFVGLKWVIERYSRNHQEALQVLASDTAAPYYWMKGLTYSLMGEEGKAATNFEALRAQYEELVKEEPDYALYHSILGRAYAGLGRKEEAIREGQKAVELLPLSKDALEPPRLRDLARIYVLVGEYDQAIDHLEYQLSIPGPITIWRLKLDPIYDPMREHPRFQALLQKH
jgi:TolB-like protein/Flp pilus assembly protein TadD